MNSLVKRSLVGLILGPIILYIFWLGGIYLMFFLSALSILLILEFTSTIPIKFKTVQKLILIILSVAQIIFSHIDISLLPALYSISILLLVGIELINDIDKTLERLAICFFVLIYFGLSLAMVGKIRQISAFHGIYPLLLVWIVDTFAYFAGKFFGKNKMAKILSPNKTIEGLIGGIFGAILIGLLFYYLKPDHFPALWMIFLGIILALLVQMGDLIASKIKRQFNLKDFSNIIPGHGGIVDRFDSFVFVMPVLFFIFYYIL
ncbi:MAG: phosphatidate cytidylyltransferase [Candidatus Zixiibacteriota bacterium]